MTQQTWKKKYQMRPTTAGDAAGVLALRNACHVEQVGRKRLDASEMEAEWKMPSLDLERDSRVVQTAAGDLVGFVTVWDSAPVRVFIQLAVHPDHNGQGIATALGRWAEERAQQAVPKAPEGARVVIHRSAYSTNQEARALLQREGYQVVRHFFGMEIILDGPPPDPVVPEGIVIRPFDRAKETEALVRAIREAFEDHWAVSYTHLTLPTN